MRRLAVSLCCVLAGCGALLPTEPDNDPVTVFEHAWREFDQHYAFFLEKRIDWDSVYHVYRPRVSRATTNAALFSLLSEMLVGLRDGHVILVAGRSVFEYHGWYEGYNVNFHPALAGARYITGPYRSLAQGKMRFGRIGADIGYIRIEDFSGTGWTAEMAVALSQLSGITGLIIDVRSNGGGNDTNSALIAGYFTDRERVFERVRYRNGPRHDQFTDWTDKKIKPHGTPLFTGPIAVLTNRGCFSTTESFVSAMQTLPNVVTVGDTTGGGSGNPYWRELPNGWSVRISRWQARTVDGLFYEGTGIPPEVPVQIRATDAFASIDTILERALQLVRGG